MGADLQRIGQPLFSVPTKAVSTFPSHKELQGFHAQSPAFRVHGNVFVVNQHHLVVWQSSQKNVLFCFLNNLCFSSGGLRTEIVLHEGWLSACNLDYMKRDISSQLLQLNFPMQSRRSTLSCRPTKRQCCSSSTDFFIYFIHCLRSQPPAFLRDFHPLQPSSQIPPDPTTSVLAGWHWSGSPSSHHSTGCHSPQLSPASDLN